MEASISFDHDFGFQIAIQLDSAIQNRTQIGLDSKTLYRMRYGHSYWMDHCSWIFNQSFLRI